MSSTSSSSTSSPPKTTSQISRASDSQSSSEAGWSTRYKQVHPKTTLPWTLVAYAAGGGLPGTIKKMTRDPREATTTMGLRRRDWFLGGKETRLFWVSRRRVWDNSSARSFEGDEDEDEEGMVAMKPVLPLRPSEPLFSMPQPNAHPAHTQHSTNTMATKPRADSISFSGNTPATSYRGGFSSLQKPSSSPGIGFGMPPVGNLAGGFPTFGNGRQ